MSKIRLDSILLFALVIPFIMTFRLSPGETPYWLFGLIFLGLFTYIIFDLLKITIKKYFLIKQILLWLIIVLVIGSASFSAILVRHQTHPIYMIHDMPLQQEIAIRFLLDGKNPYSTSYFGTYLEQWHYSDVEKNPALYHFVLLPFYIIFAIPFYFLSNALFGFFDARIPLLFLFLVILILAAVLIKDREKKLLFLTFLSFNPATLPYILEGRSDIFMFAFLFASLFLLNMNRLFLATLPLGLAFAVKQSAWPILPFYAAYIYFKTKSVSKTLKNTLPAILIFLLILAPFLITDFRSFLDSTVFYLSGSIPNSYPIAGYGFGKLLNQIGVISDVEQYFPFHIFQLLIGLPLGFTLLLYMKRKPSVTRLVLSYGIFLFIFWYFSRYLNNSHLGYLSMVFITSYFFQDHK